MSDDFPRDTIVIAGEELAVAVAATPALRRQGLMFVTDLGDLDGMLFVYSEERVLSFWMQDTLIPLDIAFFARDGNLVGNTTMTPCREDPCPNYVSPGDAQFAVEVPAGEFADLAPDALLEP